MTQSLICISTGFGLRVVYTCAKKPLRYKKNTVIFSNLWGLLEESIGIQENKIMIGGPI